MGLYVTGLRNQHAVETQAIGTNQLSYMEAYPELHACRKADKARSERQAARLDDVLATHGTAKSLAKEAAVGAVATIAGFAHVAASDDVIKNVLAAIGCKAYEIASYKALIALADAAGVEQDKVVLEQSMKEEQETGDWLGKYLPGLVQAYVKRKAA